jgi:thioredoxin family protein
VDRALIAAALLVAVGCLAALARRRRSADAPARVAPEDVGLRGRGVGVVGFSTPYCLPCRAWEEALERTGVAWAKIDVAERPELARRYDVMSTPLILAVSLPDGRVLESYTGPPQSGQVERLASLAGVGGGGASQGTRSSSIAFE